MRNELQERTKKEGRRTIHHLNLGWLMMIQQCRNQGEDECGNGETGWLRRVRERKKREEKSGKRKEGMRSMTVEGKGRVGENRQVPKYFTKNTNKSSASTNARIVTISDGVTPSPKWLCTFWRWGENGRELGGWREEKSGYFRFDERERPHYQKDTVTCR